MDDAGGYDLDLLERRLRGTCWSDGSHIARSDGPQEEEGTPPPCEFQLQDENLFPAEDHLQISEPDEPAGLPAAEYSPERPREPEVTYQPSSTEMQLPVPPLNPPQPRTTPERVPLSARGTVASSAAQFRTREQLAATIATVPKLDISRRPPSRPSSVSSARPAVSSARPASASARPAFATTTAAAASKAAAMRAGAAGGSGTLWSSTKQVIAQARPGQPGQPQTGMRSGQPPGATPVNTNRPSSAAAAAAARPRCMSARASSSATGRRIGVDPLLIHGYTTISPIANGAFSQVVRARHLSTQRDVAVKTYSKDAKPLLLRAMQNELGVLSALRDRGAHPYIANLVDLSESPTAHIACLEYCAGPSLHRALQKAGACDRPHSFGLGEALACRVAVQVGSALAYLHGEGIAHRDIKPQNVLFADITPNAPAKLCDFGFAMVGRKARTVCGTPQYMAPELVQAGAGPYGTHEVDLWAFGAMVFEMLEGRPAFSGVGLTQLNTRILRASTNEFTSKTPAAPKALLKALLKVDPSARMPAVQVLQHAWFARRACEGAKEHAMNRP